MFKLYNSGRIKDSFHTQIFLYMYIHKSTLNKITFPESECLTNEFYIYQTKAKQTMTGDEMDMHGDLFGNRCDYSFTAGTNCVSLKQ